MGPVSAPTVLIPDSPGSLKATPGVKELLLRKAQETNYADTAKWAEETFGARVSPNQINLLCLACGKLLASSIVEKLVVKARDMAFRFWLGQVVYVMMDGSMLPTRKKKKDGRGYWFDWRECKLARVFVECPGAGRMAADSLYLARMGSCHEFMPELVKVLAPFAERSCRIVFVCDGAAWIEKAVRQHFPGAELILDYYHASEHLHEYIAATCSGKSAEDTKARLVPLLRGGKVDQIIEEVKNRQFGSESKKEAGEKFLTYCLNQRHKMDYASYESEKLRIGSGPVESAHRHVLQKRLKQSGQIWTMEGLEAVMTLRLYNLNGLWSDVVDCMNNKYENAA